MVGHDQKLRRVQQEAQETVVTETEKEDGPIPPLATLDLAQEGLMLSPSSSTSSQQGVHVSQLDVCE